MLLCLAQDRVQRRAFMSTVTNFRFHKRRGIRLVAQELVSGKVCKHKTSSCHFQERESTVLNYAKNLETSLILLFIRYMYLLHLNAGGRIIKE